jgi:hypothetical protein
VSPALFVPWLVTALSCPCQAPAKQPEAKVKVTVVVILASERCQFIDPRLKKVAAELQKSNPNLTGFNLVSMTDMSLAPEAKGSILCVEGEKVEVLLHHCADKDNKVCLTVTAPLQDELMYRTVCGKFLPIVTPYQTKERVSAKWIGVALLQAAVGGNLGPVLACDTLASHRCRDRLVLAIRVEPCQGK